MRLTHSLVMAARVSELAVVGWCLVAAGVAMLRPLAARARWRVMGGAFVLALAAIATMRLPEEGVAAVVRNVAPALFVLGAYWLAGGYFVAPQPRLEQRLLAIDRTLLAPLRLETRLTAGSPWRLEALEAAYFSVYALLPLGAWAAWVQGGAASVDTYWTIVFPAEASCYIALAWLQTRPPRALEPWAASLRARSLFRQMNEAVLTRGSHRMNTIPSGHAAGAVAVALAVSSLHVPGAWLFGVLAAAICVATVVGRYHFVLDTAAGAAVAAVWWWVVTSAAR
jgi:membrane-associated phospholipid phosphatase